MPYTRVPRRYLRWAVLVVSSLAAVCAMPANAASQTSPVFPVELQNALAERHAGKLSSAIQRLQRALSAADQTPLSLDERWMITVELLYMCRSVWDGDCLGTHLSALDAIHKQFPPNEDQWRTRSRFQTILLFRASLAFLPQNPQTIKQALADGVFSLEREILDARAYIDRQLLFARYHLFLDDPNSARIAIDRALSLVLSLRDVRPWRFWVAQWLSETTELLLASGDLLKAWGVYSLSQAFISSTLPHSGLDFVEHEIRTILLLHAGGQLDGARQAAEEARRALPHLELTEPKTFQLRLGVSTFGAIACLSAGERQCASQFLDLHPLADPQLASQLGQLRELELPFIGLKTINLLSQGVEVPSEWVAKLRVPVEAERVPQANARAVLEEIRHLALALALNKSEPAQATDEAVAAVRIAFQVANSTGGAVDTAASLVTLFQKLVVALAAGPVFGGAFQGTERVTFALHTIDVLNRHIRNAEADAYARLAMAESEEDRRLLQAASRLAARHTQVELIRLGELMAVAASGQPIAAAPEGGLFDLLVRQDLTAHGREALAIWGKLAEGSRLDSSRLELPTEAQVRSALAADEALLATAFIGGRAYHVCLRANETQVLTVALNWEQVGRDIRILNDALLAGHPPSDQLDAEYPAEAAVRLYDVLLRPVADCLRGARHLVYIPPIEAIGVPLAALLEQIPPRRQHGYDLGAASWVGVRIAVSYVTSVRGFLAARQLLRRRWASLDFLGVGDPVLSGNTDDGAPRSVAVSRRSAMRGEREVLDLPELPESSNELKAVASLVGGRQTLLLRDKATEGRVRREALGQYRILDFATHGLIKNEIHGLTEGALVLTPESRTDESNDGLLTASEIADLSLNAELVVLSACNTARYDLGQFGVEVQGMASAFAIAGVPRIVATLWPVESNVTARTMVRVFHDVRTNDRLDVAESLRQAMSEAISDAKPTPYAHPRFWAAFAVFGDGRGGREDTDGQSEPRLVLRRVGHLEPPKVGEVLGMSIVPGSREVVLTGYADLVDGAFQRTVVRLDVDGTPTWFFQDRMGGSPDILSSVDGIYVTGYTLENEDYQPVVTKLRSDGSLEWSRTIRSEGMRGAVIRTMFLPGGHLLGVASAYSPRGSNVDERQLVLVELTSEGVEVRRAQIRLGTGILSADVKTVVVGDRLVMVTNEQRSGQGHFELDVYDQISYCGAGKTVTVYVVDVKSFELKARSEYEGKEVRALVATADGRARAVGSLTNDCAMASQSKLMVAEIGEDAGMRVTFSDEESYRSHGWGIFAGPNSTYFVLGQSDRVFDAQRPASFEQIMKSGLEVVKRRDRVELRDALILQLDAQDTVINRSVVSGGVSFTLTSGVYLDGRVIAAGTFGLEWSWVEYAVR
jgi:CHAT domain-containing protein